MGTSTNYDAPPQWKTLKGNVTRWARQGAFTPAKAERLLGDFVRSAGGSAAIAAGGGTLNSSRAGQRVARSVAGFISSVAGRGLPETLRAFGLESLEGKSLTEIRLYLVDQLGGPSSTIDDVDARSALSMLMDELLSEAETPEDVERILVGVATGENLDRLLSRFFAYYVYEQFCRVFYARLVERHGEAQAEDFLRDIQDYIMSCIERIARMANVLQIDWNGQEGHAVIARIHEDTLDVFGG